MGPRFRLEWCNTFAPEGGPFNSFAIDAELSPNYQQYIPMFPLTVTSSRGKAWTELRKEGIGNERLSVKLF